MTYHEEHEPTIALRSGERVFLASLYLLNSLLATGCKVFVDGRGDLVVVPPAPLHPDCINQIGLLENELIALVRETVTVQ